MKRSAEKQALFFICQAGAKNERWPVCKFLFWYNLMLPFDASKDVLICFPLATEWSNGMGSTNSWEEAAKHFCFLLVPCHFTTATYTARIICSILHTNISYSSSKNPILNLTNYNLKILTKILELNVFGTICYILSQQQFSVKKYVSLSKKIAISWRISQNLLNKNKSKLIQHFYT